MSVSLSIKNVPESIAAKLRARARRNRRSLQGELMSILENAATEPQAQGADSSDASHRAAVSSPQADGLLDRLQAVACDRGINTSKRLTRDQAHDRVTLRNAGV